MQNQEYLFSLLEKKKKSNTYFTNPGTVKQLFFKFTESWEVFEMLKDTC